ncbi:MAG TPA: hypothetical protein VII24_12450 [Pseudolabrys sp.]
MTRALRATEAAGIEIERVEIGKDGKIVVFVGKPKEAVDDCKDGNEWDSIS